MTRRANILPLALALALCALLARATLGAPAASGAPTASISARFTPERLGAATTVAFGFRIGAEAGVPAPLHRIELAYPANLGFATSGLGLEVCAPLQLEAVGVEACPPDSRMGYGSAEVEMQIGPLLVREAVKLMLFAGPSSDDYLHLLVYATGFAPVLADVVLPGVLLPGHIEVLVPPIPGLPGAADVSVTQLRLTLGGDLTYFETVGGRSIAYRPAGVGLPRTCPRAGFPFAATFGFTDGTSSSARTAVACPRQ